jgi:hypothetical protein
MPTPPNLMRIGMRRNSQSDQSPRTQLLTHKISNLKKRVLEGES